MNASDSLRPPSADGNAGCSSGLCSMLPDKEKRRSPISPVFALSRYGSVVSAITLGKSIIVPFSPPTPLPANMSAMNDRVLNVCACSLKSGWAMSTSLGNIDFPVSGSFIFASLALSVLCNSGVNLSSCIASWNLFINLSNTT